MFTLQCLYEFKFRLSLPQNPYRFLLFLLFLSHFNVSTFQMIKQILMSDKDNLSKHKLEFLNDDFVY